MNTDSDNRKSYEDGCSLTKKNKNSRIEAVGDTKETAVGRKSKKLKSKIRVKISVNAFHLLMDSQKKVIGSNSPGKKLENSPEKTDKSIDQKVIKSKRKALLEQWADAKGAGKKKASEENRSVQVVEQLKRQKKRFKNMLLNKSKSTKKNINISKHNTGLNITDKILSDSDDSESVVSDESDDFVKKLQPSIKKTDISGYFQKLNDTNSNSKSKNKDVKSDSDLEVIEDSMYHSREPTNGRVAPDPLPKLDIEPLKSEKSNTSQSNCSITHIKEKENVESLVLLRENRRSKRSIRYVESSSDDSTQSIDSEPKRRSKKKFKNNNTNSKTSSVLKKIDKNITAVDKKSNFSKTNFINEVDLTNEISEKNVKLAPMFLKSNHKPKVDSALIEARQKFLYSEMPKCIEKQIENIEYVVPEHIIFPKISHVQQFITNDDDRFVYNFPQVTMDELLKSTVKFKSSAFDFAEITQIIPSKTNSHINGRLIDNIFHSYKVDSFKDGLQFMKTIYPKFPIFKVFKQLKQKYDLYCSSGPLRSNSQKGNPEELCEDDLKIVDDTPENEKCLWTEKYKPLLTDEIIGNFKGVDFLKKWLTAWKNYSQEVAINGNRRKKEDSSDDFCSSDSNNSETSNHPNNTIMIAGPQGSGKTNAVYAIANELEINILEINASSKRTGKKIITELQEATQSHKVSMRSNSEDILQSLQPKKGNKIKSNKKSKTNTAKKKKRNTISSEDEEDFQKSADNKMSLILIEDADIVFEEDDGFISSLTQIIQISKRPIIITVTDTKCNHLKKIMQDCSIINFHSLSGKILAPWLDIIILLENGTFLPDLSEMLIEFNKGDMRKTIQQVQFWIANNESNECHHNLELIHDENSSMGAAFNEDSNGSLFNSNESCIKDCNDAKGNATSKLFEKLTFCSVNNIHWNNNKSYRNYQNKFVSKKYNQSLQNRESDNVDSLSKLTDMFSNIDIMLSKNENLQFENINYPWQRYLTDSLSESENMQEFTNQDLTNAVCQYLLDKFNHNIGNGDIDDVFCLEQMEKRSVLKHRSLDAEMCMGMTISASLSPNIITLDYLPLLRNICRVEKIRSTSNIKRNNRFYHYLKSLDMDIKESVTDEICKVFNI